VILKTLPKQVLESYKRGGSLNFRFNGFRIKYIPSKSLTIQKNHHSTVFFDIAQFYHVSLVNAYQDNIRKLSESYLKMKTKRSVFSDYFFKRNKTTIREYCIDDCKLTKELSQHWIDIFSKAFELIPNRMLSPGYLAEKVLLNQNIHIPRFSEIPYDIQELAYNAYFGGRFELIKRGNIGKAHLYDINSAYPYAITKIPDLTKGHWFRHDKILDDSLLGFFKIECDIPDSKLIAPFPFRKGKMIFLPSGKFITFVTLEELRACKDTFYNILDSYQYLDRNPTYPYRNFIENLYCKRLELKKQNSPLQLPIKIILNSIYGKTGEIVRGRIGNLFNPVIFAFITGHARAQLYSFVQRHGLERDVVAFATDSICTTKPLEIDSDLLGEFSRKSTDNAFYVQNGFYRFGKHFAQRGLGRLKGKEIENFETVEKDGKLIMKCRVLRSKRLRSSILSNTPENIGKFSVIELEIDLNADRKRLWLGELSSMKDKTINVSVPLNFDFISIEQV